MALGAMFYSNVGQMAMLNANIDVARKEASHRLSSNPNCQIFTITASDFELGKARYQGEQELYYDGKLYDIVDKVQQGKDIQLQVLRDNREEGLLAKLKDTFEQLLDTDANKTDNKPIAKQSELTKDFLPIAQFTFLFTTLSQPLFCMENMGYYSLPLLQVLKSPPQVG